QGAAGSLEAGVERRRLPGVAAEQQRFDVRALGRQAPQDVRTLVAAAVVDGDDLERLAGRQQNRRDLVDQRNQVLALVVDGKDDADVHVRGQGAFSTLTGADARPGWSAADPRAPAPSSGRRLPPGSGS